MLFPKSPGWAMEAWVSEDLGTGDLEALNTGFPSRPQVLLSPSTVVARMVLRPLRHQVPAAIAALWAQRALSGRVPGKNPRATVARTEQGQVQDWQWRQLAVP